MAKRKSKKVVDESDMKGDGNVTPDTASGIEKKVEAYAGQDMDLSSEIDRNLRLAVDAKRSWAKVAKEDVQFALGDQWEDEDKATLADQKRPCLTFNKIKPMVQLVAGHMIQNQARIQVVPEGGEDENFSAVMDRVLDHIDKMANIKYKMGHQFAGGERAGRTWMEFCMDYDEDPIFGHLRANYLGWSKIYMDPNGENEYDLSDCEYGFKVVKLSKGKLKQLYPKKAKALDQVTEDFLTALLDDVPAIEGDTNNYGADPRKPAIGLNEVPGAEEAVGDLKQFTVVEYWKREFQEKWFCYFVDDGTMYEYDTEEEAKAEVERRNKMVVERAARHAQEQAAQQAQQAGIPLDPNMIPTPPEIFEVQHVIRKRKVPRMKFAVKAGDMVCTEGLEDSQFEPHYHGFPWFQYIAEWSPEAESEEYKVQSLTRSLKDPQKEVNKSRSQYLHIINTCANSGWIGDEDALSDNKWDELQQFGSVPGITVQKKKGSQLDRLHPVEVPMAQQVREKTATDNFKEVSGLNADLLAVDSSKSPSGRAIALRIRQAVTILQPSFTNYKYTKQLVGRFLFRIVPSMFDEVRVSKILGQRFMQERGIEMAMIRLYMNQVRDGKYDVEISDGSADTMRQETLEDLMFMVEKGMPLPPKTLLEWMNLPNKQEVINDIQEYEQQQQQAAMALEAAKRGGGEGGPQAAGSATPAGQAMI